MGGLFEILKKLVLTAPKNQFHQTAPGDLPERGAKWKGCLGTGEASGQGKTCVLIAGHFCDSESKLVCFVSTIEHTHTPLFWKCYPA